MKKPSNRGIGVHGVGSAWRAVWSRYEAWTKAAALAAPLLLTAACGSPEARDGAEAPPAEGTVVLTPEQVRAAGVRTDPVRFETLAETLEVPAQLTSPDTASVTLGSVVEGRVASVRVLPGDIVEAGQALMEIHSHELTDALRDLRASEASLAYARAALERSGALFEAGAVSREEVERRTAEHARAEAEVARAQEWVHHLSPSADGLVVVRAPRGGSVFSVGVSSGTVVVPGSELVSLGRTDVLWAAGWAPERSGLVVRPGDSLDLAIAAVPGTRLRAKVVQVGAAVDPVRRAIEVRAEVRSVPDGLRPGLFATMVLPNGPSEPRAVLPEAAVQRTGGREVVFVEDEPGVYRAVPVISVPLPGGLLGVTGLTEGARVVVEGAYAVRSVMEGSLPAGEGS